MLCFAICTHSHSLLLNAVYWLVWSSKVHNQSEAQTHCEAAEILSRRRIKLTAAGMTKIENSGEGGLIGTHDGFLGSFCFKEISGH